LIFYPVDQQITLAEGQIQRLTKRPINHVVFINFPCWEPLYRPQYYCQAYKCLILLYK
jgi:hypothetical protein